MSSGQRSLSARPQQKAQVALIPPHHPFESRCPQYRSVKRDSRSWRSDQTLCARHSFLSSQRCYDHTNAASCAIALLGHQLGHRRCEAADCLEELWEAGGQNYKRNSANTSK
eukprot:3242636-Pleurochrysis_carterae.AAC.1